MRQCARCPTTFEPTRANTSWCDGCRQAYYRAYRKGEALDGPGAGRPKLVGPRPPPSKKSAEISRRANLRAKFGLTVEQYDAMFAAQGGICAICKAPPPPEKRLSVDHCHVTGVVRGLLCNHCNAGIGFLKENPASLLAALAYLGHPVEGASGLRTPAEAAVVKTQEARIRTLGAELERIRGAVGAREKYFSQREVAMVLGIRKVNVPNLVRAGLLTSVPYEGPAEAGRQRQLNFRRADVYAIRTDPRMREASRTGLDPSRTQALDMV